MENIPKLYTNIRIKVSNKISINTTKYLKKEREIGLKDIVDNMNTSLRWGRDGGVGPYLTNNHLKPINLIMHL